MKILQLCNKPPYPPVDGGCIAMNAITQGLLQNGHTVKVLAMETHKHPFKKDGIPKEYLESTKAESVYIDTRVRVNDAFSNLFSGRSYNIERFHTKTFSQKLAKILENEPFDIIQMESIFVGPYLPLIRQKSKAKVILRTHNVEYKIWERLAENERQPLKKWYLKLLAKRLKRYETSIINQVDGIAAITPQDKDIFIQEGCTTPIEVIPLGINPAEYNAVDENVEFPSVFHLGSMDWLPNEEGIRWFLKEVWPGLHDKFPHLPLYLAGRQMPHWLSHLSMKNVKVMEDVPDAKEFIRSKAIMIVPLLSGSGMRVKIIEGMALGKTIVSTSLGAQGIQVKDGQNILLADDGKNFSHQIEKCIENETFCRETGMQARKLVEEQYDNRKLCRNLTYFYEKLSTVEKAI